MAFAADPLSGFSASFLLRLVLNKTFEFTLSTIFEVGDHPLVTIAALKPVFAIRSQGQRGINLTFFFNCRGLK